MPALIVVGLLIIVFASLVALWIRFYFDPLDAELFAPMFIDGVYSVDDGEWKPIDDSDLIKDTFQKNIRFRGTISGAALNYTVINISSCNVWYSL